MINIDLFMKCPFHSESIFAGLKNFRYDQHRFAHEVPLPKHRSAHEVLLPLRMYNSKVTLLNVLYKHKITI